MDTRYPNIRSSRRARLSASVLTLLLLPTVAVPQVHTEAQSHRILPPDAARLSQLQAQAALLYRLQQFSGKDLPGVSDPARKERLQKIMQQMAMKLGQSSLDMGGRTNPGRSRTRPGRQPGRTPGSRPGFRPGGSQPGATGNNTPTGDLRSFLEQISGRSLDDLPDLDGIIFAVPHRDYVQSALSDFTDKISGPDAEKILIDVKGMFNTHPDRTNYAYWVL